MESATQVAADGLDGFGMIGTVLWTMLRSGAMSMAMPLVGSRAVPHRVRVLLSGALAIALSPMLPPVPAWTGFDAAPVLSIARELALGVSIGVLLRLVFEAGAMAGELVSQGTGLAFAQMSVVGISNVSYKLSSSFGVGSFELRSAAPDCKLLATTPVPNSGGWDN